VLALAGLSNLSLLHADLDEVSVNSSHICDFDHLSIILHQDWGAVLSLGEQQRVAFARCFYMRPTVVILDESTSALDPENEELMCVITRA
jgi:ABC-type uncharacterized transport system fused permease/ATPase subunit